MHLIIGGKYMGKLAYARTLCGTDAPVCDLSAAEPEAIFAASVITNLQDGARAILKRGGRPLDFFEANLSRLEDKILIGDEIGSGVVPVDPFERLWRDETGFLYQFLAAKSELVDRVWAGIPCRLKAGGLDSESGGLPAPASKPGGATTGKLIFFDIDGTLVSHAGKSHIPEPTVQAVRELTRNGHVAAIATARNLALTRKTAALLNIDLVVCCNGAHVTRLSSGRDIHRSWLGDGFVKLFRAGASALSEHSYALDSEYVYTDWEKDFFDDFIAEQAGPGHKKKLAALERGQLAYVFSTPPSKVWAGRGDVDAIEAPDGIEFRPTGASKWSGIVRAAADAGFALENVIAVGDGWNDMEMVKNASLGIAVGGAKDTLKAAAGLVTEDIDAGGILSAFRSLGMV